MAKPRTVVNVDEAVRRSRARAAAETAPAAAPPPPPAPEAPPLEDVVDVDALEQLDTIYEHMDALEAGGAKARLDVYLARPLPAEFRGVRKFLGSVTAEDLRASDGLEHEGIRIAQTTGHSGDLVVQFIPKVRNPRGGWEFRPPTATLGMFVPASEVATAARAALNPAAAASAPTLGVEKVFEVAGKIEEQARRNAPPPAPDPLDFLVKAKEAGLIGDSTIEKMMPLVPAITAFVERVFAPKQSPYDKFVEGLIQREFREARTTEHEPEPAPTATERLEETRAILEMAGSLFGVAGGERATMGVEAVRVIGPLLPRMVDSLSGFGNNAVNFARERMYYYGGAPPRRTPARAPAPTPPAAVDAASAVPEAGSPASELMAVLEQASPWAATNDVRHYPELLASLCARVAGAAGLLNELQGGRVDEAGAYASLGSLGVEVAEPLAGYLKGFLTWVRQGAGGTAAAPGSATPAPSTATPPPPRVEVRPRPEGPALGRCDRCGAEYNYPSRAILLSEREPCDASVNNALCGGKIVAIEEG